jgi:hypothetical protein
VSARVVIDTILVKESVMDEPDEARRCGQLWHEWGHVVHGADESGSVFAAEIAAVWRNYPGQVAEYVIDFRKLAYLARTATDEGYSDLLGTLEQVLPPDDVAKFLEHRGKRGADFTVTAKGKVKAEPVINVGDTTGGQIDDLKRKLGMLPDSPDTIPLGTNQGDIIKFGGCNWRVVKTMKGDNRAGPGEEPVYDPAEIEYTLLRLPDD